MSALEDPRWLALPARRRDELLEKYRNVNVEVDDWYSTVYEDFKEKCSALGIYVNRMYFTGFACQGDGASFTGHVEDWSLLLPAVKYEKYMPSPGDWTMNILVRGSYCHSGTMYFDVDLYLDVNPYDVGEDPLQHDAWALGRPTAQEIDQLKETIHKFLRGLADGLYKDLEEEYDYQTSDEQVVNFLLDYDGITLEEPADAI